MITVRANARNATYISNDLITSGSVGIPVTFNLSEDFDGLSAIAVFEGSGTARDVALIGDSCVVPHEVLTTAGGYLRIGIYASNSAGTIVIPTVWAGSKMILQGTEPSEVDPSEPTPSWVAQVQEAAAEALTNSEEAIEIAGGADAAAADARQSASAAATSATAAEQSASAAGASQTAAEAASGAAASARDAAVAAQSGAESSAQAAAGSATAAAGSAAAAAASEAAAREVQESIPVDYADLSADVVDLKSQTPSIVTPEETDADLYICDSNGNVIAKFQDGGIQVKNFDSGDVGNLSELRTTEKETLVAAINESAESGLNSMVGVSSQNTDSNADFYLSDLSGNGLVRLSNGNIQTKAFNSDNSEYKQTFAYTNTSGRETLNHFFPAGTVLAFHLVQNNVAGSETIGQYLITYGYTDRGNVGHTLGQEYGYNYFTAELPDDAVNVYASYGTGLLWNESGTLAFSVFSEANYARKPIVVTVSPDGTKDYTSLRAAVDGIKLLASDFTPYEIHVFPGTYNLMSDYTDAEIGAEGFKGLFITNGISVIGQGERSEIILSAELSTDDYSSTKRNDVSTLNLKGNIRLENMTVIAKNIRYCIHDDSGSMVNKRNVRVLRNVKLRGYNLTTVFYTYGAGGGNGKVIECYDCDFTHAFHVHNTNGQSRPYRVLLENCTAKRFTFSDYANVNTPSMVTMNNCKCASVEISAAASGQAQTLFINGVGTYGAMYDCPAGYVYCLGDCIALDDGQIAAGYAVKLSESDYKKPPVIAKSVDSVYGISLGIMDNTTIVQTSGYISSKTLGMSGLAIGDYLTIDTSTGEVISGGTDATAIAKVTYVDSSGTAFAKLTI